MSDWISAKPIGAITWDDLERIITEETPEGPTLEFKRDLSVKGGTDGAQGSSKDIPRAARDALLQQICAFANSYGGTLFLGIDEGDGIDRSVAKELTPLPDCVDFANRFEATIRSMVDPPVPGVQVRGVPRPSGSGEGVVILRVSDSTRGPHGYGRPSAAYIRRGTSVEPMTMQDLQAAFWESRTRGEVVHAKRARFQQDFADFEVAANTKQAGVFVRISAIPQHGFRLPELRALFADHQLMWLRPSMETLGIHEYGQFKEYTPDEGWSPRAHGVRGVGVDRQYLWDVIEDGSINVVGFLMPLEFPNRGMVVTPAHLLLPIAQVLFMADLFRSLSGEDVVPIEVDIAFRANEGATSIEDNGKLGRRTALVHARSEVGPFLLGDRANAGALYSILKREAYASMGLSVWSDETVTLEKAFAKFEPLCVQVLNRIRSTGR